MHKHQEHLDQRKLKVVNFVSFLIGFSQASMIYLISTYFAMYVGEKKVGIFFLLPYLVILWALLNLHKFVHRLGKIRIFIFTCLLKIAFNILLITLPFSGWSIFVMVIYVILTGVEWVAMDSILETFSTDKLSGHIRGIHLTILNLGFIFGPFLSTRIFDMFNFHGVFLIALAFNLLIFFIALITFKDIDGKFKKRIRSLEVIILAVQDKRIFSIYYISFVLEFFYAIMIIYTFNYISSTLGFGVEKTGYIFTVMLIPFVILQYPAGILADRKNGEKKMLIVAILIMAITTIFFYFFAVKNIVLISLILFGTRVGAALIEILRDSYFYKLIDGRDVDFINFFRSAMPLAYVLAASVSYLMIEKMPSIFSVRSLYLVLGIVVLTAIIPALKLKESR